MQFLKKHYEKIILGLVLVGLVGVSAFLPMEVGKFKESLEVSFRSPKHKPLEPLDLSTNTTTIRRLVGKTDYELDGDHNLFNPVTWKKSTDGITIPDRRGGLGAQAVTISDIRPLYLRIEHVNNEESGRAYRYNFKVAREASKKSSDHRERVQSATLAYGSKLFKITGIKGPEDNPSEFLIEINDTGELITVKRGARYEAIEGYTADLSYSPEKKSKNGARSDDKWTLNGEDYKIVAIDENEVVLSAASTLKRTVITWKDAK